MYSMNLAIHFWTFRLNRKEYASLKFKHKTFASTYSLVPNSEVKFNDHLAFWEEFLDLWNNHISLNNKEINELTERYYQIQCS